MIATADDFCPVQCVEEGNIAVVSGLKSTVTGDTLTRSKKAENVLAGVAIPHPVVYASIEPESIRFQKPLELALANLSKEDPSFRVSVNEDTGQTVLSGMGELHLEILLDRIRKEYKVEADMGQLLIAYKETIVEEVEPIKVDFKRHILGHDYDLSVTMSAKPMKSGHEVDSVLRLSTRQEDREAVESIKHFQMKHLKIGFKNGITKGPILGFPVFGVEFTIHAAQLGGRNTPETLLSSTLVEALIAVLKQSEARLLEPIMRLEISADESQVEFSVKQDLMRRRAEILEDEETRHECGGSTFVALAPLSELRGYSRHLRTMTSGGAAFGMELSHHALMEPSRQQRAIDDVTGVSSQGY